MSDTNGRKQSCAGTDGDPGVIALYHRVDARENFGDAAEALFTIVRDAARKFPGLPRYLYLDIDGHSKGGRWDADADAVLAFFVPVVLSPWLARYQDGDGNEVANPAQRDDVPDGLYLVTKDGAGPRIIGLDGRPGRDAGKTVIGVTARKGARL